MLFDIYKFIKKQKVTFIASIDEAGNPNIKAVNAPRKIEENTFYFSTNTSSKRVQQFLINPNASIYFYKRGFIHYKGIMLIGTMEVLTDEEIKRKIWKLGDSIFYKKGVTDPDYCVLRFTAKKCRLYCDLKTEEFEL